MHLSRQWNCWSLRCSWGIACRRCSNCIFIINLTPGFNIMGKDNCKTRPETFMFGDWVRLILENWRYMSLLLHVPHVPAADQGCSMSAARATCTYKSCQKYLELIKPQGSGQRSAHVLIPGRFDSAKVMLCKQYCLYCPFHRGAIFLFFWKVHDQSLNFETHLFVTK